MKVSVNKDGEFVIKLNHHDTIGLLIVLNDYIRKYLHVTESEDKVDYAVKNQARELYDIINDARYRFERKKMKE